MIKKIEAIYRSMWTFSQSHQKGMTDKELKDKLHKAEFSMHKSYYNYQHNDNKNLVEYYAYQFKSDVKEIQILCAQAETLSIHA